MNPRRSLFARYSLRPSDALRALGWLTLLTALIWGGLGCSSLLAFLFRLNPFYPRAAADRGATFARAPIQAAEGVSVAASIVATNTFDIVFDEAELCPAFSEGAMARGLIAFKVPDALGQGVVSQAAERAPYVAVNPFGQAEVVTRYDLVAAPARAADIEALLPIAQGEAAHWETFAFPPGATWDCAVNSWEGVVCWAFDYDLESAVCEGCPTEMVFAIGQPVSGLPFRTSGAATIIARAPALIILDPSAPPPILTLAPEFAEWITPAQSNLPLYHELTNHDPAHSRTVDLTATSSRGAGWGFYTDYAATQRVAEVTLAPGAQQVLYVKRDAPADFTGFEYLELVAVAREDDSLRAVAVDSFGVADDWTHPVSFSFAYVPMLLKR